MTQPKEKPKFGIGAPVMLNPDTVKKDDLTEQQAKTLLPPLSYIGTVVEHYQGNPKACMVQWYHLGDDSFLFYENELRWGC